MIARQEYFKGTQAYDQAVASSRKQIGATIDNDHLNVDKGDTVARQDAAVKAGNAPGMFYGAGCAPQWHQLGDILDVTDVVNQLQDAYGPVEDIMKVDLFVDDKWYGIPYLHAGERSLLAERLVGREGDQALRYQDLGEPARCRVANLRPLQEPLRLGHDHQPQRRRQHEY